jgi:hypothetical protein
LACELFYSCPCFECKSIGKRKSVFVVVRSCLELACRVLESLLSFNVLDSAAECFNSVIAVRVVLFLAPAVVHLVSAFEFTESEKKPCQSKSLYPVPTPITPWVYCVCFPTSSLSIGHRESILSRKVPAGTFHMQGEGEGGGVRCVCRVCVCVYIKYKAKTKQNKITRSF